MSWQAYPHLDERVYRKTLPNGLTLAVVPREGFQKKLAYFVTDYGSIHTAQVWSPMPGTRERRGWLPAGACKAVLGRTE